MRYFIISEHVSRRICRTRYAERRRIVVGRKVFFKARKINFIFKRPVCVHFKISVYAGECTAFYSLVCIADVLRNKRKYDALFYGFAVYSIRSAEHIEKVEKRALASVRNGDIFRPDFPAVFSGKAFCNLFNKFYPSLRSIISSDKVFKFGAVFHYSCHLLTIERFHLRNARRVSAAHKA